MACDASHTDFHTACRIAHEAHCGALLEGALEAVLELVHGVLRTHECYGSAGGAAWAEHAALHTLQASSCDPGCSMKFSSAWQRSGIRLAAQFPSHARIVVISALQQGTTTHRRHGAPKLFGIRLLDHDEVEDLTARSLGAAAGG